MIIPILLDKIEEKKICSDGDDLMDYLFELIIEGFPNSEGNPRIPKWFRVVLITLFFGVLETLFIVAGITARYWAGMTWAIVTWFLGSLMLIPWILFINMIIKKEK